MGWIFLIGLVALCISLLATTKFEEIAKMKGHAGYFWWCFLFGIVGWLMVVALPDKSKGVTAEDSKDELPDL